MLKKSFALGRVQGGFVQKAIVAVARRIAKMSNILHICAEYDSSQFRSLFAGKIVSVETLIDLQKTHGSYPMTLIPRAQRF
jgi:hypothetical protein